LRKPLPTRRRPRSPPHPLSAGLAPSLVGSGVAWGVYFYAYNAAKARFRRTGAAPAEARLSAAQHMRAAAEAGAIVCLATNPLWVAKTRLQLQQRVALTGGAAAAGAAGACAARAAAAGAAAGAYAGLADCLVTIARTEGVRGLYKGLLPSMLLVSHGVIQFVAYEELKALAGRGAFDGFTRALGGGGGASSGGARGGAKGGAKGGKGSANCAQRREPTHAEVTAFGALSKLAASVVTYPSQVRARAGARVAPRGGAAACALAALLRPRLTRPAPPRPARSPRSRRCSARGCSSAWTAATWCTPARATRCARRSRARV
jgi:solute carrier family 25 folate transporter 32